MTSLSKNAFFLFMGGNHWEHYMYVSTYIFWRYFIFFIKLRSRCHKKRFIFTIFSMTETTKTIDWISPIGNIFSFTFKLEPHYEARSVTVVNGEINATFDGPPQEEVTTTEIDESPPATMKKQKTNVGYLSGYIIKRNNKLFHHDADAVSDELRSFATKLYDSRGKVCRVPESDFVEIPLSHGGMFLLELIEIDPKYKGMDLGINFIHEVLNFVKNDVGVCVLNPSTISEHACRYKPSWSDLMLTATDDRTKQSMRRSFIVKLRRQLYRIGFRVIKDNPNHVDQWYLKMDAYKSNQNIRESWLSKDDVKDVQIAMPSERYVKSESDKILLSLIQGLTELDNHMKDAINLLERAGASLIGINALHIAVASKKREAFLEYLISEKNVPVDARDDDGNTPLHVAAVMDNVVGTRFLISKGADKNAVNDNDQTPMQAIEEMEMNLRDFQNVMGIGFGMQSGQRESIKRLLRG